MGKTNYNTQIGICRLSSTPQGSLRKLIDQAEELITLEERLNRVLPVSFRGHVQLASFRNGHLLVHCASATWATRLRLMHAQLLEKLKVSSDFQGITRITPKIRPAHYPRQSAIKTRGISQPARDQLAETADHIEDPRLAAALRALASRK